MIARLTGISHVQTLDPTIVLETKLHPPPLRGGLVPRVRLLNGASPVVVLCAPAGYGKTTVLAQYAASTERPLAWLTLDEADDDPVLLLLELATALARLAPVDARVFRSLQGSDPAIQRVVLPGLVNSLAAVPNLALALDDLHLVGDPDSLAVVAFLCDHVPAGAQLLVASRDTSALPLGRLRLRGSLVEISARDLALDRAEVEGLLQSAGVPLDDGALDAVVEQTEGWPVAVSLVALSIGAATDRQASVAALVAGDDRDVVDYFSSELLLHQPPERLSFLMRTSILERLCAPLCDEVLARDDSASMLARLDEANLFLLPIDRARKWYRYHHLFRDVLRGELTRRDPGALESLHRRASEWHDRHGTPEEAVQHALAGHDLDRAAELVVRHLRPVLNTGRQATARRWLDAFSDEDVADSATLALAGAFLVGLIGEKERARRYIALAERAPWRGVGAMGETSSASAIALIEALFGWEGVTRMRTHALEAYRLEPAGSSAHEPAATALGFSLVLLGRAAEGVPLLEEAAALGAARATASLVASGQLAQIALDEGRTAEAEARAREGLALADALGLEEQTPCCILHAAAASLGAQAGDARARAHLERALPLMPRVAAFPWMSIQTRVVLGRVAIAIGELATAETLLGEARRELARFPDGGVLPGMLAREERALAQALGGGGVLAEPLTDAERRVLELLPSHLSLEEIGQSLHISRNTVKAHLRSIYRKLGVGRRSDAVESARRHGLVAREA